MLSRITNTVRGILFGTRLTVCPSATCIENPIATKTFLEVMDQLGIPTRTQIAVSRHIWWVIKKFHSRREAEEGATQLLPINTSPHHPPNLTKTPNRLQTTKIRVIWIRLNLRKLGDEINSNATFHDPRLEELPLSKGNEYKSCHVTGLEFLGFKLFSSKVSW